MLIRLFGVQETQRKGRNWPFCHFFLSDGNCWIYFLPHYLMLLFWPSTYDRCTPFRDVSFLISQDLLLTFSLKLLSIYLISFPLILFPHQTHVSEFLCMWWWFLQCFPSSQPASSASLENLLEVQILGPQPRPQSDILGWCQIPVCFQAL